MTYGRQPIRAELRMAHPSVTLFFGLIEVVVLKGTFLNFSGIPKVLGDQFG